MTPPTTYAAWSDLLDRFGAGDDDALPVMAAGRLEGGAGVSERWARRITNCQNQRLNRLNDQLAAMLSRARDPMTLSTTLIVTRRALDGLRAFAAVEAFPAEVRTFLRDQIDDWASRQQASLERSASSSRNDRGLKALRDTPLTSAPPASAPADIGTAPRPTGRRVVL